MFYCQPYNETNVSKFSKLIDDMENIDICHSYDIDEPMLICQLRINQNSIKFKTYISRDVISSEAEQEELHENKILLTTEQHIVQFLNTCFLPYDPNNESKSLAIGDIFSVL
ncbi:uncharacterized protein BX663DRAFT_489014 [Cokeromyces recurvatus]|uniref:uncharacterized protein n=1 Tax=Cokeromyces recurvatus TaxID=90255 RepID=UPI00222109AF|nr:uncharacterized protein BX663DRAFT_489014 [Cokeromyces recurvatus]KAI7899556.1 hypothetical protein BX663DRAFT_489014 [Cokeromyces recurvatus]